jgi:hypothetical protein
MYIQPNLIWATNLFMVVLIFLNTFFLNVPIHRKLLSRKDIKLIDQLVMSNWPRTLLWTIRSIGLICIIWIQMRR